MPEERPGDQPQICARPGCDEVVVQSDPGNKRLYHSAECRRTARRLRHEGRDADTADLPPVAATSGQAAADLATATELAATELAATELAAAELPGNAELPGSAAGHEAVDAPEEHGGTDADEDPSASEFWNPGNGEAEGFWDADEDSHHKGPRSPGRHRSLASQRRSLASQRTRLRRSHTAAIAITLAASAAGLGLIFSQPSPRHPLASDAQLHPIGTQTASRSSSPPAKHARTRHAHHHAAGGSSHAPRPPVSTPSPPATHSRSPSPTTSPPSSPPSPKPKRSPKHTAQVPHGMISFENGTDGWKKFFGNLHVAQTTQVAYSGSHSLWITARGTYSGVGVDNGSVAHLQPGDTVTFHIYSDGQSGGSVLPFAELFPHPEDLAENVPLPTHRGWFTLTWTVPSVPHVEAIGMQIVHHDRGPLRLAIDALTWTGS
jgi:hypothetical protein